MKKFLEEYGWTIVLAIVVILIISIASPLGSSIKGSITNIVNGFGAKANFERIDNTGSVSDNNDSGEQLDLTNINVAGVVGDFSRKGNLVTINDTQYRVLAVNGNQIKVMSMESAGNSAFNSLNVMASFGDKTGQKYAGSTLDQAMTTYYNGLPTAIKSAIVPQTISQSMYSYSYPMRSSNKVAEIEVGQRHVYALDVDDVIEYLGEYSSSSYVVNEMFFNTTSSVGKHVWLRSASSDGSSNTFYVNSGYSCLSRYGCGSNYEVRPAFVIDLSLLN